ncbi:alpha/beta fold hydrolase [Thalassovita taeanensis]|uniref:Lysophospholipase, alpha-beta hydrolase superfamily n=1 Tax=Thalassovita taeanensis TaxID=657014 RepID=A0A1H9DQW1_9RHOB|nr:alpha/beta hydrolase [Thalassovita taeanensis]SEQ15801.1 Lysophospholipase, alpha-beta hydrolase superfamily [Thalassovita taeanensis]
MTWTLGVLALILVAPFVREALKQPMNARAREQAPGEFVNLSQGITHFRWIGPERGPVAVCVHGLTTPSFVWEGVAKGLAAMGFQVLIYDLYGRGFSDRPKGLQDRAFFLRQLEDLLATEGVADDITLLGYSMGGAISTAFAAEHPGRIRRLILLAPAGMGHDLGLLAKITRNVPILGDWLMLTFFARNHRKGTEAERALPSSVERIVDKQQNELTYCGFVPAILSSLRGMLSTPLEAEHRAIGAAGVPVLAVWGRDDSAIPIRAMGVLAQWNHAARHEVIDGAGHGLTYTHTDQVVDAIAADVAEA